MSALEKFIASARKLHAEEKDPATRWEKMTPLLQELLADPSVKEQSRSWPDCSQGGERAENLLFYEDPDYKFVINGLIKAPHTRTQIHDHAQNWTLYGVLDGPSRSSATSASMTGQNLITPKCASRST